MVLYKIKRNSFISAKNNISLSGSGSVVYLHYNSNHAKKHGS